MSTGAAAAAAEAHERDSADVIDIYEDRAGARLCLRSKSFLRFRRRPPIAAAVIVEFPFGWRRPSSPKSSSPSRHTSFTLTCQPRLSTTRDGVCRMYIIYAHVYVCVFVCVGGGYTHVPLAIRASLWRTTGP